MKLKIAIAGMVLLVCSFALSMNRPGQGNAGLSFGTGGNPEPLCVPPRCPYPGPVTNP
jgi:hypothetical protein